MATVMGTTTTGARNWIYTASIILLIVGGLNWGLVGLFGINLVAAIFGVTVLANIIYILVGIAAVYVAVVMIMRRT